MFRHTVVRSAVILTAANIITRLLGFFYRIFMSNAIGAEGMGLYQLITPVYMLVWAFSSAGLSTAVSKLTAEQRAAGTREGIKTIAFAASGIAAVLASAAAVFIFVFAKPVSIYILKDGRAALSLRILALCFPFMAVGSCIRGVFYGLQDTAVPAQCQVTEQCTRMAVVYVLSFAMLGKGLEYACAMAVTGMAAGEAISFMYAVIRIFYGGLPQFKPHSRPISRRAALGMLTALALPLTLNRITGTLLAAAENLLIPSRLQLYGLDRSAAVALYGKLCGMALPLVMFPSSLLTALATALMPAVSEANAAGRAKKISSAVERSLTFTAVVGIGTAGLFMTLSDEIGRVIYRQRGIGSLLRMLSLLCPFIYMQVTLSGILNGLGKQLYIFAANLVSSVFNIACTCIFVPKYGINAYMLSLLASTALSSVVSMAITAKTTGIRLYFNNFLLKPAAAAALSFMSLKFFAVYKSITFCTPVSLVCAAAFSVGLYTLLTVLTGAVEL